MVRIRNEAADIILLGKYLGDVDVFRGEGLPAAAVQRAMSGHQLAANGNGRQGFGVGIVEYDSLSCKCVDMRRHARVDAGKGRGSAVVQAYVILSEAIEYDEDNVHEVTSSRETRRSQPSRKSGRWLFTE